MEIRINGHKIKAQILPIDKPTLDETLESFSFSLVSNDNPMPFAPCQSVQVITDSNEKINLFLVSDSVEVFSVSPTRWKHNITCVQNTRKLSKHLVRNSSFTTPYNTEKRAFSSATTDIGPFTDWIPSSSTGYYKVSDYCNLNEVNETVHLRTINGYAKEKIKNAYFRLKGQYKLEKLEFFNNRLPYAAYVEWDSITDINELKNKVATSTPNLQFMNRIKLNCVDSGGNRRSFSIGPTSLGEENGWYPLNKKIQFDRIKELADQGYNDFSLEFDGSLVSGGVTLAGNNDEIPSGGLDFIRFFCFQAEIVVETYYYNCYQILDLLRIRQQKTRHENGNWVSDPALFVLDPNRDLEKMLIATPAPNFTFTQMTMYECVAEVFRLFDAIFTMDENGYLGIEYFNERNGRNITDSLKKVGQNSTSSEDKYTNGLVAYYQNAKPTEEFPNNTFAPNGTWASIKTRELAVPASNNSFIFETPHTIDMIQEMTMIIVMKSSQKVYVRVPLIAYYPSTNTSVVKNDGAYIQLDKIPVDISKYVIEEELWTLLDTSQDLYNDSVCTTDTIKQVNTIFYKKGTKEIDVSYNYKRYWIDDIQFAVINMFQCALWRMFGTYSNTEGSTLVEMRNFDDLDWDQIFMRCRYVTDVDGRIKVESFQRKYDGETLIDQYNGAVDLNKMGLNILGLSLKLGNPTLTVTQKITSWNNRIKQGDIYNYEGKTWIANVVAYTFLGDGKIQATIQFVQNFNNLAMRTRLLREKRLSLISNELTVKSEENLVDYVYFATDTTAVASTHIGYKYYMIATNLFASLGGGASAQVPAEVAVLETSGIAYKTYIPMIKYGSGNMICHEISYEDPVSAGKQTATSRTGVWFDKAYFTSIIKYTNDYGEFKLVNIHILPSSEVGMVPELYPYVDAITAYQNVEILDLEYHKQPNEIFALNYQLCFLPVDANKDFIGSRFINYNAFVNDSVRNPNDLVLYYRDDDFQYSVLDIKGDGSTANITSVSKNDPDTLVTTITFGLPARINATSWAICEKDGTILFASNRKLTNANTVSLCFSTNAHRIDNKILDEF